MRNRLWTLVHEKKYQEFYLLQYREHYQKVSSFWSFFGTVVSLTSVAGWSVWSGIPWLWSILLGLAQMYQVARPYMRYTKNLTILEYALPQFQRVVLDLLIEWNGVCLKEVCGELDTDTECNDLYDKYSRRFLELDLQYGIDKNIPDPWKWQVNKTDIKCDNFFKRHYGINTKGESIDDKQQDVDASTSETASEA